MLEKIIKEGITMPTPEENQHREGEGKKSQPLPSFEELLATWRKEPNWANILKLFIVSISQWVCWIAKPVLTKDGYVKISKPPVSPKTGRLCDVASTDPEKLAKAKLSWGTFEEAKKFWETHTYITIGGKKYPVCGIGFVLTKDLGIPGMDLDNVIDQQGNLLQDAQEIINKMNSYTEKSPSGHGIRILPLGNKPGTECKKVYQDWAIEIYEFARFLTVTGDHLPNTLTTIEHRQKEIEEVYNKYLANSPKQAQTMPLVEGQSEALEPDWPAVRTQPQPRQQPQTTNHVISASLSDEEIIEKAKKAKNGKKFITLFERGDISNYGNDDSRADLALCTMIAFYTQNHTQIDRIFRHSALYRQKWNEPHGDKTYGETTIKTALTSLRNTYKANYQRGNNTEKEKKKAGTEVPCYIGEKGQVIPGIAAHYFIERQANNLVYYCESFWRYKGGVWTALEDKELRKEIGRMLGESLAKRNVIEDILYQVTGEVFTSKPRLFDPNPNFLNFPNGMLDITKEELLPHDRNYFSTIQFPFDCPLEELKKKDPSEMKKTMERLCPIWWKFLGDLKFQRDTHARLSEWGGYCLTRETRIEKCLYLKGEGANGKSTFLEGLLSVLRLLASDMELSQIFEKFKIATLQSKLVNVATDIDTNHVVDPMFKKLVSGEEVEAEKKFKNPFKFRPFCKFLFSANDFIPTKDRSHGFFRRFDVLEFKRQFSEKERDENVKETVKSGNEAKGIFCWMYWGLRRLIQNKWKMTPSQEFDAAKQEFEMAANPLKQFIEECCIVDKSFNERGETIHWVAAQAFRQKYVEWCREKGYEVLAENKLGREIKRLGFGHHQKRTSDGKQIWIYWGLAFTL
jgi:putative DNA primase/helicase